MGDKKRDYQFSAASGCNFVKIHCTLEETGLEPEDQCLFNIQVEISDTPAVALAALFNTTDIHVEKVLPSPNTVALLNNDTIIYNLNIGATKEVNCLVTAGATPGPYDLEITITPQGAPTMAETFTFPVPEQT